MIKKTDLAAVDIGAFADVLLADRKWARKAMDAAKTDDQQHARRAFVRTTCALFEGMTSAIKTSLVRRDREKLDLAELMAIHEVSASVNEKGEARERPTPISAVENLRFAFKTYVRLRAPDVNIDYGGAGWVAFRETVALRNRLTHPACVEDLAVSEEDLKNVKKAYGWFQDVFAGFHK